MPGLEASSPDLRDHEERNGDSMPHEPQRVNEAQLVRLLTEIHSATDVDTTFGGLTYSDNASLAITNTRGTRTQRLRDLAIHRGLGLGGKAISLHRPVWVRDYPRARGITHDYDPAVRAEQLRAIFAIPLTIAGDVRAVLYGALRQDVPLGDRTLNAAELAKQRCLRGLAEEQDAVSPPTTTWETSEQITSPAMQELRTAHDDLLTIAAETTDESVKHRLTDVCHRMRASLRGDAAPPSVPLSPREITVLAQVAEGRKNREIAECLGILPGTVKAYLQSAMRKLGTNNRMQTVNAARRGGLLP